MNLSERVQRVDTLPPALRNVLACVAQGMSNDQIARSLGYKNGRSVATVISQLYTKLGLRSTASIIEKRTLAGEAFKKANDLVLRIPMSKDALDLLTLSNKDRKQLRSARQKGYKVDTVSIVLKKP